MKRTDNPLVLGCVYKNNGVFLNGRGAVYDTNYIAPTILTMSGGGNKPMVVIRNTTNIRDVEK